MLKPCASRFKLNPGLEFVIAEAERDAVCDNYLFAGLRPWTDSGRQHRTTEGPRVSPVASSHETVRSNAGLRPRYLGVFLNLVARPRARSARGWCFCVTTRCLFQYG